MKRIRSVQEQAARAAPLHVFMRSPTPANACRLAIADHKGASPDLVDWQYVRALERAAIILEGNTPEDA